MQFNKTSAISPAIFRAYDIRGIVGDALTPDAVYTIGLAIGSEAQARGEKRIIVARDGRLSGPQLAKALTAGLLATGCDVWDIGAVPTPVLYFATHHLEANSGVMLTGSHNPSEYNGLKIVLAGATLADDDIQGLYQRIQKQDFIEGRGTLTVDTDVIIPAYLARVTQDVHLQRPLRVVIDCGNGIAGRIAPLLMRALGCETIDLYCEIDGNFPNHHPDPSVAHNLQDLITAVAEHQADLGLAFDGDGDRLGVVTNTGEIIWPDRQMMLFAIDILTRNPGALTIYDVKCTSHLAKVIAAHGGESLMWKTGHSLVKAKLRETGALLAGEMSGHIFFKERWYGFDDALYTAARLLEILSAKTQTASEVFQALPDSVNTPELKLDIAEENKFSFMEQFKAQAKFVGGKTTTIDGLRVDFDYGWGLVRPSNTTPCLVMRFEATDANHLQRIQDEFRVQLLALDAGLQLPF